MALPTIFPVLSTLSHFVPDAVGSQVIFSGAFQDGLRGAFGEIIAPNHKSKAKPGKRGTLQPSAPQNKKGDIGACGGVSLLSTSWKTQLQSNPRLFPGKQKETFTKI